MAYETSTATNPDGLLDALRIFATAQGWTIDKWESQTNGYWLSLHKGTQYVNLVSDSTWTEAAGEIKLRGATGYDSGLAAENQPGSRTDAYWAQANDLRAGAYVAYHFFAGDQFIHCVVEVSSGRYVHFGFGVLDKSGTYDGGEYVYANCHYLNNTTRSGDGTYTGHTYPFSTGNKGTQVRFTENDLDITSSIKDWATFSVAPASYATTLYAACWLPATADSSFVGNPQGLNISRQPNYFNGVSMLIPYTVACGRRDNLVSILGEPKEMRAVNIKTLAPGQEMVLGADIWMLFPIKQKGEQIAGSTTPFSLWYGIAYKKVV